MYPSLSRRSNWYVRTPVYPEDILMLIACSPDGNIYGNHPFYLDTRYYEVDKDTGDTILVTTQNVTADADYISYSHGFYQRNAHAMEALLLPTNITWRALGGSIDLYFLDGPSAVEVTK
jgi:alpha-glucosidase